VDRITGRYSNNVAEDWRLVEESLRHAYHALMSNTTLQAGIRKRLVRWPSSPSRAVTSPDFGQPI